METSTPHTVELFGLPRILAGQKTLVVPGETLASLAAALVHACPALAHQVIAVESGWLREGYTFVVDERFTREPDYRLPPGAAVLLVSSVAGG
jgi:hypothetical protein